MGSLEYDCKENKKEKPEENRGMSSGLKSLIDFLMIVAAFTSGFFTGDSCKNSSLELKKQEIQERKEKLQQQIIDHEDILISNKLGFAKSGGQYLFRITPPWETSQRYIELNRVIKTREGILVEAKDNSEIHGPNLGFGIAARDNSRIHGPSAAILKSPSETSEINHSLHLINLSTSDGKPF